MMAVELDNVVKRFGTFTAVERTSLAAPEGGFVTLLGPSGCGKTTTLRMIAGLLDPSEGEIRIAGKRVNETPIHKRNLGVVFQSYALFPHKSVFDNVAFGLKYRGVRRDEAKKRVESALELVRLPHVGDRYPRELSGGQQQRIALARAIVIEPDVLLLDEPLSALDANLREDMRVELKRIQERIGVATIFVTHDQSEALAMSDLVVVMSDGRVEQSGPPREVYSTPATGFVARFLGAANMLGAVARGRTAEGWSIEAAGLGAFSLPAERAPGVSVEGPIELAARPEKIDVAPADAPDPEGWLCVDATIEAVDYQGQSARYFLRAGGLELRALSMIDGAPHERGAAVRLRMRPADLTGLPEGRAEERAA